MHVGACLKLVLELACYDLWRLDAKSNLHGEHSDYYCIQTMLIESLWLKIQINFEALEFLSDSFKSFTVHCEKKNKLSFCCL